MTPRRCRDWRVLRRLVAQHPSFRARYCIFSVSNSLCCMWKKHYDMSTTVITLIQFWFTSLRVSVASVYTSQPFDFSLNHLMWFNMSQQKSISKNCQAFIGIWSTCLPPGKPRFDQNVPLFRIYSEKTISVIFFNVVANG